MIRALIRKELRQQLPLILGLAAILLWNIVVDLVLEPPDVMYWSSVSMFALPGQAAWTAWVMLAMGLMAAYALLPGEHDQKTIEFLYTLPVRRGVVFLVKFLVGGGLLAATSLVYSPIWWWTLTLNPNSFARRQIRADLLATELGLLVVFSFMAVAYGLLLAFFRRLGWLLFALIWLALVLLARLHPPLQLLNVLALFTFEHHGTEPIVPWGAWQLHAAMSALALAVAARLWLGSPEDRPALFQSWRAHTNLRRLAIGLGLVGAALAAGFAAAGLVGGGSGAGDLSADRKTVTVDTRHFRFTYFPDHEREAGIVAREADRAFQRLQAWLPTPELETIVADLTEASTEHQGIAGWQKMRLDVRGSKPTALLHHLLYHETAHVLAAQLSQGASRARQAELRFFSEGLAEYLAYELVGRRDERTTARQIAALARRQFQLRWEALLDPGTFLAIHHEYLLYALGEVWVAALVQSCGTKTLAGVLGSLGDPDSPQNLTGPALWQHALSVVGCDLGRVSLANQQMLARLAPDAERLPRASAGFVRQQGDVLLFEVEVKAPTPGPWTVVLRVRDNADSEAAHVATATHQLPAGRRQPVAVSRPALTGRRFEFQAGASAAEEVPGFFTRWVTATLR